MVRKAVLAGVVLSHEPLTRHALGQEVVDRFAGVLPSLRDNHVYDHVRVLADDQLVVRMSARKPARYRVSAAGVEAWRAWLVSPINAREPERDALTRLRSCRDDDFSTMNVIVDLFEEETMRLLERPPIHPDSPLTAILAHAAQRTSAVATLRWCQEARDEIAARAASRR